MNSLFKNLETRSFSWWEPIYIYRLQLLQIAIEFSILSAICWPVTLGSFAAVCILREGTEQQIIICCVYNHHKIKKKVAEIVIWWVICYLSGKQIFLVIDQIFQYPDFSVWFLLVVSEPCQLHFCQGSIKLLCWPHVANKLYKFFMLMHACLLLTMTVKWTVYA